MYLFKSLNWAVGDQGSVGWEQEWQSYDVTNKKTLQWQVLQKKEGRQSAPQFPS